ncbi:MAG: proline--tRNA ligase [Chthoniobacterales bacterium]
MSTPPRHAISPTRHEDFPEWYQQVVRSAEMAENSEVRGCMVIKPWGYALWERMQSVLDGMFKATGHRNAYFPLFIPLSHLQKEAEHVEGFAKECAVVTHHRLEMKEGKLIPAGELTEPLIIRPTSETIIGSTYAKWVKSYRDLPILLNQWANVVRWELRPRLFLRTAEFLWQEGHTAHETEQEAIAETEKMHEVYRIFLQDYLAVPVVSGEKTASERFPGAVRTYSLEAMMQDGKGLQATTSHFLGQNFAKAFGIEFQSREGKLEYAWTTSWGATTRLIGMLLMVHGDDDGAILPPRVAASQVVIIPFIPKEEQRTAILEKADAIALLLRTIKYAGEAVRVEIDSRDVGGSTKNWDWIKRGAPLRLEIGPRDLEAGTVALARRDRAPKEKESISMEALSERIPEILAEVQHSLWERALAFQKKQTYEIDTKEEFYNFFGSNKTPVSNNKSERSLSKYAGEDETKKVDGGFALTHWNGSAEVEAKLKEELKVTIRCIPHERNPVPGICPFTGEPSAQRVLFGKAY